MAIKPVDVSELWVHMFEENWSYTFERPSKWSFFEGLSKQFLASKDTIGDIALVEVEADYSIENDCPMGRIARAQGDLTWEYKSPLVQGGLTWEMYKSPLVQDDPEYKWHREVSPLTCVSLVVRTISMGPLI